MHFKQICEIGAFCTQKYICKAHISKEQLFFMDFAFLRKSYWHQHGLSALMVHLEISQTFLSTGALLEGWDFIRGIVQDLARVYRVQGLGPSCKVCMSLA